MILRKSPLTILALAVAMMAVAVFAWARPSVTFREVMATYHAWTEEDLQRTIDGWEASPKGWSVAPRFEQEQAMIFCCEGRGEDGLLNMRQRLESIGGTCEWLPRENGGTIVEMKFPLS